MTTQGSPVWTGECVHDDQVSVDFADKAEDPIPPVAESGDVQWPGGRWGARRRGQGT